MTTDDLERDRILSQRIGLFGWIQPTHLDVPEGEGSEGFLMFAQQGMFMTLGCNRITFLNYIRLNRTVEDQPLQGSPRQTHLYPELLQGHLRSAVLGSYRLTHTNTMTSFSSAGLIRHLKKEEGADTFVPILIYVVLKANPDHLLSNVE